MPINVMLLEQGAGGQVPRIADALARFIAAATSSVHITIYALWFRPPFIEATRWWRPNHPNFTMTCRFAPK
jgi:hypothetical protein